MFRVAEAKGIQVAVIVMTIFPQLGSPSHYQKVKPETIKTEVKIKHEAQQYENAISTCELNCAARGGDRNSFSRNLWISC